VTRGQLNRSGRSPSDPLDLPRAASV